MLKPVSKLNVTWSAFAIQDVIFNREEMPNILDIPDVTKIGAAIAAKPKTTLKKN